MAVSFAAAMYRWKRILWFLSASLLFVWPIGAVMAGLEVGFSKIRFDPKSSCKRDEADVTGFVLLTTCFFLCLVCYVCSAVRARKAGDSIRRRVWNRANWYLVVALLTFGPTAVRIIRVRGSSQDSRPLDVLAVTLLAANGLFNGIVYSFQSSYVRRTRAQQNHRRGRINQINGMDEETMSTTPRSTPRIAHQGSFHVAFQEERTVFEVCSEPDEELRQEVASSFASTSTRNSVPSRAAPVAPTSVTPGSSVESDSEWLLGCFEASPHCFGAAVDAGEEETEGFPAHIFVVGSPPRDGGSSPLVAASRR